MGWRPVGDDGVTLRGGTGDTGVAGAHSVPGMRERDVGAEGYGEAMIDDDTADLPIDEFAFPGPLRDRLVAAILAGDKTTTTSLVREYDLAGEPLPVAHRAVVVDSDGRPVAIVAYDDPVVVRCGDVTLRHAVDEGEGYRTVADWRAGHEGFWHSEQFRESIGDPRFVVSDDELVVMQRFRLERAL